ncbi:LPS assembly lipoprotein LptE [Novipirellula artificiosorum]|uniref:Lipopolysaccharide-assembly n=1 Tax=Novipirellula artificiosorum TaxID=2528016 RepID=A0A5C6DIJ7_9BACT|nr:LPS assembly lipoprotein LptE [Novipirellula artificiosorum]TWU37193.1 hypothetical protein Poly41_33200 [Novipirellula artificiosorum]
MIAATKPIRRNVAHGFSFAVGWTLLMLSGCAMYQYGPSSLYRSDIRTVHVPIVRNMTFRHDLGVRLTEALVKEIEDRTPYKVTGDPNADSTLVVTLVSENKTVLTETSSDDPRALDASVTVEANWMNRRGELLLQNSVVPNSGTMISFSQASRFVPEAGQSIDTATQAAIEDLAERIVSQMEFRW